MVVVELGTVLCSVVVVLGVDASFVSFTLVQAESDTRAAVAKHAMISLFISIIVVWFVNLQNEIRQLVGQTPWGVTLPYAVSFSSCGIRPRER